MFDYVDTCIIDNTSFCVECYERLDKENDGEYICDETGGKIKGKIGCGGVFGYLDMHMIDNTSFCVECYERIEM